MFDVDLKRLSDAMASAELDQSGLARAVGCTPGAINQIILGNVRRSRLLPEIARELGVTLEWLMGDDVEMRRAGVAPARLRREEFQLLDNYRPLRNRDRVAVDKITAALRLSDDLDQGKYPLPHENALARMFEGLLESVDRTAPADELARELAQLLPTGLSQLRGRLTETVRSERSTTRASEALASGDREQPQ